MEIGREEGRQGGRDEAREEGGGEGREEGRGQGKEEGREQGREQGREEGREQDMQEGRASRRAWRQGGRAGLGGEKSEIRTNRLIHLCSGLAKIEEIHPLYYRI